MLDCACAVLLTLCRCEGVIFETFCAGRGTVFSDTGIPCSTRSMAVPCACCLPIRSALCLANPVVAGVASLLAGPRDGSDVIGAGPLVSVRRVSGQVTRFVQVALCVLCCCVYRCDTSGDCSIIAFEKPSARLELGHTVTLCLASGTWFDVARAAIHTGCIWRNTGGSTSSRRRCASCSCRYSRDLAPLLAHQSGIRRSQSRSSPCSSTLVCPGVWFGEVASCAAQLACLAHCEVFGGLASSFGCMCGGTWKRRC